MRKNLKDQKVHEKTVPKVTIKRKKKNAKRGEQKAGLQQPQPKKQKRQPRKWPQKQKSEKGQIDPKSTLNTSKTVRKRPQKQKTEQK